MPYKNKYFKSLVGKNNNFSFIAIAGQVEYTTQATLDLFVANAAAGELGVYNATTKALISGAGAVGASVRIQIAVRDAEGVKLSPAFTVGTSKMTRSAYQAAVKGATSIVFNAASAVVAGDEIGVKIMDLTIGGNPVATRNYNYRVKAADTFDNAMTALAAMINDAASIINKDVDPLVTATYTGGTNTLLLTNVNNYDVTKVLVQGKLAALTIDSTTITKTVVGSGHFDDAKLWEEAMFVRDGVTTLYPSTPMTNPDSFGKPASVIASSAVQFNHYTIEFTVTDDAKTVHKFDNYPNTLELLVASNGAANAEAEVKAILGL
jgi:hypothetical protein